MPFFYNAKLSHTSKPNREKPQQIEIPRILLIRIAGNQRRSEIFPRDQTNLTEKEPSDQLIQTNNPFFVLSEIVCLRNQNKISEQKRVAEAAGIRSPSSVPEAVCRGYGRRPRLLVADRERERK